MRRRFIDVLLMTIVIQLHNFPTIQVLAISDLVGREWRSTNAFYERIIFLHGYEGDTYQIYCHLTENKTVQFVWLWKPTLFETNGPNEINENFHPPGMSFPIEEDYDQLTGVHTSTLRWLSIPRNASGTYICQEKTDATTIFSAVTNFYELPAIVTSKPGKALFGHIPLRDEKLKILSETVPSGSRFQLTCTFGDTDSYKNDQQKIRWSVPPIDIYDKKIYYESQVASLEEKNGRVKLAGNGTNQWVLEVRNASYLDTGLYACMDERNLLRIWFRYIYVLDEKHLILPPAYSITSFIRKGELRGVVMAFSTQTKRTYLGCGPTDPSVTIELSTAQGRKLASTENPYLSFAPWTFDPIAGFELYMATTWDLEGEYVCSTADNSQERRFTINIIGTEVYAQHGRRDLKESDKLVLTCKGKSLEISVPLLPHLTWHWKPLYRRLLSENSTFLSDELIRNWNCSREEHHDEQTGFIFSSIICDRTPVEAAGNFECRDEILNNQFSVPVASYNLSVQIAEDFKLSIAVESEEVHEIVDPSSSLILECVENGGSNPATTRASWYVNYQQGTLQKGSYTREGWETIINNKSNHKYRIQIEGNFTQLTIPRVNTSATYECEFENSFGTASKRFVVKVRNHFSPEAIAAITVASLVVLGLPFLVFFVIHRCRKKNGSAFRQSIVQLLEGNLSQINPDTPLDAQAELLPYQSKWEFPEDSLFLETQIGSGHFGRVVKARAIGIAPPSKSETEVAVKMVKSRADWNELKCLVSELKVLAHLGSQLNIVNLLGAVTQNIEKGSLMVIVEYCRHGNLKDYLIKNRNSFIDELDDEGNMGPQAAAASERDDIVVRKASNEPVIECKPRRLHKKFSCASKKERNSGIATSDLIEWSFEIASGMHYLGHKKVIHGDLAARNVLLAEDNVVKIADFGLARKFYQNPNYYKEGKEALPVKWMAIESIKDGVFSNKSDVWSFGVTLWELFSLGNEPYADIESSQLLSRLEVGYRLGKPDCTPNVIGDMMSNCWKTIPDERSTFDRYEQALGSLLDPELLALYKMPYDQYGYITADNPTEAATDNDHKDIPHGYLELRRSDGSQKVAFNLDSNLALKSTSDSTPLPPVREIVTEVALSLHDECQSGAATTVVMKSLSNAPAESKDHQLESLPI